MAIRFVNPSLPRFENSRNVEMTVNRPWLRRRRLGPSVLRCDFLHQKPDFSALRSGRRHELPNGLEHHLKLRGVFIFPSGKLTPFNGSELNPVPDVRIVPSLRFVPVVKTKTRSKVQRFNRDSPKKRVQIVKSRTRSRVTRTVFWNSRKVETRDKGGSVRVFGDDFAVFPNAYRRTVHARRPASLFSGARNSLRGGAIYVFHL